MLSVEVDETEKKSNEIGNGENDGMIKLLINSIDLESKTMKKEENEEKLNKSTEEASEKLSGNI